MMTLGGMFLSPHASWSAHSTTLWPFWVMIMEQTSTRRGKRQKKGWALSWYYETDIFLNFGEERSEESTLHQITGQPHYGNFFLLYRAFYLSQIPSDRTQIEKCQAREFKQKGLRQFISHFSNFAVYICKPHLFTCPVFVKVNSFRATT